MVFFGQAQRIQNRLQEEARCGPFYAVLTDKDSKEAWVDASANIPPAQVIVKEIAALFGDASRNRRRYCQELQLWRWKLDLAFNQEVTSEAFEGRLLRDPIILPREPAKDLGQVTVKFLSADRYHPPQQSPSVGTGLSITFEAELSPV